MKKTPAKSHLQENLEFILGHSESFTVGSNHDGNFVFTVQLNPLIGHGIMCIDKDLNSLAYDAMDEVRNLVSE